MVYDGLDHGNVQGEALAITLIFPILATLAVSLRLYSRSLTSTFGSDDWVICVAAVIYWGETYCTYSYIKLAYIGWHTWDFPKGGYDTVKAGKYGYAVEILYNPILALIKTSILLFLWRLRGQKRNVKIAIIVLLAINLSMMIGIFVSTVFKCVPIGATWYKKPAKCINFSAFATGSASLSTITDAFVLILPTWIVYDLQIQRRQKIMLIGILSFGLVTVISGIVRIVLLDRARNKPKPDKNHSVLFTISTIEVGLAFIAACAPYMKPILAKHAPGIFGSTAYGQSHRPSRKDYELSERTRRSKAQNNTKNGTNSEFDPEEGKMETFVGNNGLIGRTETTITHDSIKAGRFGHDRSTFV
ncbi:hypothetical protein B0J14DRAFT_636979 [Halenospora varia]|nr:hypothetical protein B0J14DRAFT_636979 [Halenospora varia]